MLRALPIAPLLALVACEPTIVEEEIGFGFDLNLNLAGDEDLLDEMDLLEIGVFSQAWGPTYYSWEWFDVESALVIEDLPPGEGYVFEARGLADGVEIASGKSESIDLPGTEEVWVLFHRHGAFLELDPDGDVPRIGHEVVAVDDGAVVIGGETGDGYAPISRLIRTENAGYALEEVGLAPQFSGFTASRILTGSRAGQIFIAGGAESISDFVGITDAYSIWDPATDSYTVEDGTLAEARFLGSATPLGDAGGDGKIVLLGGALSYEEIQHQVSFSFYLEVIDPATGESSQASMADIRWLHPAVRWGPDITVTCGGFGTDGGDIALDDSCDTYSPVEDTWTDNDGVLQQARAGHSAVIVPGDEGEVILLIGGSSAVPDGIPEIDDTDQVLGTAEIIESVGGTFESTELIDMVHPRTFPFAAWVPQQERVLVCGGHDGTIYRQDCEYFDPDSHSFEIAEGLTLPQGVGLLEGAVLDDGSILLVGGNAGGYEPADFAVLYLP